MPDADPWDMKSTSVGRAAAPAPPVTATVAKPRPSRASLLGRAVHALSWEIAHIKASLFGLAEHDGPDPDRPIAGDWWQRGKDIISLELQREKLLAEMGRTPLTHG